MMLENTSSSVHLVFFCHLLFPTFHNITKCVTNSLTKKRKDNWKFTEKQECLETREKYDLLRWKCKEIRKKSGKKWSKKRRQERVIDLEERRKIG